jgi:hypothetical protein
LYNQTTPLWNSDTNYRPYIRWGGTSVEFDFNTGQITMYNRYASQTLWKAFDVTPSLPTGVTLSNPKFQLENNGTLAFYPNSTQQTIKLDVIANIGGLCVPPYESWKNKDFDNSELSGRTLLFDSNNGVNRTWQTGSYVKFKDRVLIFNYFGQVVIGQPGSIVNGKKTLYVKTNGTIGDKKPLKNTYILNFTNTNNGQAYVMDGNTNINDIIKVNFDSAARIKLEYSISSTNNGVYTYKLRLEPSNSTGGLNSHDNL